MAADARTAEQIVEEANEQIALFTNASVRVSFSDTVKMVRAVAADASANTVTFECVVVDAMCNHYGSVHGGWAATATDILTTLAMAALKPGCALGVSIDLAVSYLGSAPLGSTLTLVCSIAKLGSAIAFLELRAHSGGDAGKVAFVGRHTKFLLTSRRPNFASNL